MTKYLRKYFGLFLLLVAWEISARLGLINKSLMPAPLEVLKTFINLIITGEIVQDAADSLRRVVIGFSVASILGITLGLVMGSGSRLKLYMTPVLEIIRPIPPVAFVPISVLWFGIGDNPAYFLVSLGAFFPIFTNTLAGVLSVNPIHRDAALCLGASKRMMVWDITLPAIMPYLVAGLKTGLGTGWFCVIIAELVGAQSGLGYMIQLNRLTLQSEKVLAGMMAIGIIGFLMNRAMIISQRYLIPWYDTSHLV